MNFPLDEGVSFELSDGDAHHVTNVLRGRPGDTFEAVDSERRLFEAELNGERGAEVLREENARWDALDVRLYQAVPKGKHMDLVVEKATELGVGTLVPLMTERGDVKMGDERKKVERWRRIAESAARQSLQLRVPEVRNSVSFVDAARDEGRAGVMLHNEEGLSVLEEFAASPALSLFVGPEGGWSESELELGADRGLSLAQLGWYRLRSETAGIVAVARARATMERNIERLERSGDGRR